MGTGARSNAATATATAGYTHTRTHTWCDRARKVLWRERRVQMSTGLPTGRVAMHMSLCRMCLCVCSSSMSVGMGVLKRW